MDVDLPVGCTPLFMAAFFGRDCLVETLLLERAEATWREPVTWYFCARGAGGGGGLETVWV